MRASSVPLLRSPQSERREPGPSPETPSCTPATAESSLHCLTWHPMQSEITSRCKFWRGLLTSPLSLIESGRLSKASSTLGEIFFTTGPGQSSVPSDYADECKSLSLKWDLPAVPRQLRLLALCSTASAWGQLNEMSSVLWRWSGRCPNLYLKNAEVNWTTIVYGKRPSLDEKK